MEVSATRSVFFTSELPVDHLGRLEDLLFFNENQGRYREVVVESIERFGEPRIRDAGGVLRLHTSRLGEVQALFAVEQYLDNRRPVAVAVYARTAPDTMTLLHVVVHSAFATTGPHATELVTMRLIREVVNAAKRIKGIERLEMLYGAGQGARPQIRVRPAGTPRG